VTRSAEERVYPVGSSEAVWKDPYQQIMIMRSKAMLKTCSWVLLTDMKSSSFISPE